MVVRGMPTVSETLFENFCQRQGLAVERVRESLERSPDYIVELLATKVIVEVKQIEPNPEESRLLEACVEEWDAELTYHWGIPGERIRKKIVDAMPQLRALGRGRLPTVLVVHNTVSMWPELADEYAVRVAMFGIETATIVNEVAPEGGALVLARWYGGRKRVSDTHNMTLSAVGILDREAGVEVMQLFHNPFAQNPLPIGGFGSSGIREYRIGETAETRLAPWVEVIPAR